MVKLDRQLAMIPLAQQSEPRAGSSRRGSVENHTEPRFLVVGQISKPHGVRGDVRVAPYTELPERFTWLDEIYIGEKEPYPVAVEDVRFHKNWVLLKLAGYNDRDAAASLRGQLLQVREDQAIPLQENEYFLYQLEGMAVISEDGTLLGELVRVIETGANNVFVVRGGSGELLIPDTTEVVRDIDFEKGRITVHLLPGLLST
jgi:16S rRNA processing protein RimM